jgi:hypothetical protein
MSGCISQRQAGRKTTQSSSREPQAARKQQATRAGERRHGGSPGTSGERRVITIAFYCLACRCSAWVEKRWPAPVSIDQQHVRHSSGSCGRAQPSQARRSINTIMAEKSGEVGVGIDGRSGGDGNSNFSQPDRQAGSLTHILAKSQWSGTQFRLSSTLHPPPPGRFALRPVGTPSALPLRCGGRGRG